MSGARAKKVRILKFGGTSLADAGRIATVVEIVAERAAQGPTVVVVSALAGVTNDLAGAAAAAQRRDPSYTATCDAIGRRHEDAANTLTSETDCSDVCEAVERSVGDLRDILHGVRLVRECSPRTLDSLLCYGEILSATLVVAALRHAGVDAEFRDARRVIVTDARFGGARVDRATTAARVREQLADLATLPVIPGFVAGTRRGETTTLGRGGSDYTAVLIGAALDAEAVEIWSDVDGVMSADPRVVPGAFSIPALSYDELMELAHFGARVVYPPAVHPARERGVPLVIRNTLNREFPGTRVVREAPPFEGHPVRGIASINDVTMLRLEGDGMAGSPGIAARLFGALGSSGINIILISQASSERSICFAVEPGHEECAKEAVEAEFALELRADLVDELVVEEHRSVIAAVGEGMRETPGIAGRLFNILGRSGVNVQAIAQGSSELNISLVVAGDDKETALRAIHDAFFLPGTHAVQLFLAGVGRVGSALLEQIGTRSDRPDADRVPRIAVVGLANSRAAVVEPAGIDLVSWRDRLKQGTGDLEGMIDVAVRSRHPRRIFVDCTASDGPAKHYERLLHSGVPVVAANKRAVAGPGAEYRDLIRAASDGVGLYVATTVGAGLPILRPIGDLVATGDTVRRIEGVLSGTLTFLFDRVMKGDPLSAIVRQAFERGFTEPDPREDLAGTDVARKLVILARTAGIDVEPEDVKVEPVLPAARWSDLSLSDFWDALPEMDDRFNRKRAEAAERGTRLCYLAAIQHNTASVGTREIGPEHLCWGLTGTDNLVAIYSDRYSATPMVVRGPGAGPEVTAAGVFADILRAAAELAGA